MLGQRLLPRMACGPCQATPAYPLTVGDTLPPWLAKFMRKKDATDEQERKRLKAVAEGRLPDSMLGSDPYG